MSQQSAGQPNRDGNGNVKFDVRNPSILPSDSREEDDAVLEADVIGGRNSAKRGAVNLDGYDSDSDNETFNTKAAGRKKGKVDIHEKLDNYDAAQQGTAISDANAHGAADDDDEDNDDMFAMGGDDGTQKKEDEDEGGNEDFDKFGKKRKGVKFLDAAQILGQDGSSKSGGHIRLDEQEEESDVDEQLAIEEEGVDEEVGAGGQKRNAPRVEAFNLKSEMEEGQFDQAGNYVRKAVDPDAVHDMWLEGVSKKDMKKAAEAHEKRAAEAQKQRLEEADVLVSDLLKTLILQLEPSETPLEALARLGKGQTKTKKVPKWKLKKMSSKGTEDMEVESEAVQDPEQARIKESIDAVTDAADKLLSRDFEDVYEQDRELLIRAYRRETGNDWREPVPRQVDAVGEPEPEPEPEEAAGLWEFRWTDGRDGGAKQGPFDSTAMKAWQDAGYFGKGVEFRVAGRGDNDGWVSTATFA